MDIHSKETRSYNMSCIKSTESKPENIVRKFLFAKGLRYSKNSKKLPGCPDIVLKKYKTIVFVNGCFWHMHNCKYFVIPKSNNIFWEMKLNKNKERDLKNINELEKLGWNVITVWECQLKSKNREVTLNELYITIKTNI